MARYNFKFLSELYDLEVIARGDGVHVRKILNARYGRGRWRKLKGKAVIEYSNGEVCLLKFIGLRHMGLGNVTTSQYVIWSESDELYEMC